MSTPSKSQISAPSMLPWDQLTFLVLLVFYLGINLTSLRKEQTAAKQPTGDNVKPPAIPKTVPLYKHILRSMLSFKSSILVIGLMTETYLYGGRLMGVLVSKSFGYILAVLFMRSFLFKLDKKSIKTPYEYFEKRYNHSVWCRRLIATCAFMFHILYASLFLWSATTILCTMIMPSLHLFWVSNLVLGFYAFLGHWYLQNGYRQRLRISYLQFGLFITGLVSSVIITYLQHPDAWEIASKYGRLSFIYTDPKLTVRYTVWNQIFSSPIPWCVFHVFMHPNFGKYRYTIESNRSAQLTLIFNLPFMFVVNFLLVLAGIYSFVYFYDCDPIYSGRVANKNQIASYWLLKSNEKIMPGLGGVCLASVATYGIINHSACLANCKKIILGDIVLKTLNQQKKSDRAINTVLSIVLSTLSILLASIFQYSKNSIQSLFFLFNNWFNSVILGVLLLAFLNPYSNSVGAMTSVCLNLGINLWLGFGYLMLQFYSHLKSQEFKPNLFNCTLDERANNLYNATSSAYTPTQSTLHYLYSITSFWFGLFSLLFMLIVGSIISLVYSFIRFRRYDADVEFKEHRAKLCIQMFFEKAAVASIGPDGPSIPFKVAEEKTNEKIEPAKKKNRNIFSRCKRKKPEQKEPECIKLADNI